MNKNNLPIDLNEQSHTENESFSEFVKDNNSSTSSKKGKYDRLE